MSDTRDIRRRLKRLGRTRTKSSPAQTYRAGSSEPLPGDEVELEGGRILRVEKTFRLQHQHGTRPLADFPGEGLASLPGVMTENNESVGSGMRWLFLDTETTGLAGGAGSFAFLVGVGVFDGDMFRLRQYFMRTPAEEAAMLAALKEDFGEQAGFVTYNGRTFDIPLLEMRYMIGRRERLPLGRWPQLDLLHLSRRLWRRQLPDCTLGTVERHILQVTRTEEDVPGAQIPRMYQHFLQTGETREMKRVLYHNEIDILSLVVLAAEVHDRHLAVDATTLSGSEALGVARWHLQETRLEAAENAFRQAANCTDPDVRLEGLQHYTAFLKRTDRRDEAAPIWQRWHRLDKQNPSPCIELAMYYEWHQRDYQAAIEWTEHALETVQLWPVDWRRMRLEQELHHRLARLQGKLARLAG